MCGIAGIYNLSHHKNTAIRRYLGVMEQIQKHRGPDGSGFWVHDNDFIGFAHQRLSIIDLSENGDQPMRDDSGNWIIFNGEIYNYLELKDELGPSGFKSSSDTEVILKSYQKWGKDCVNHFRGMFAFAIWDNIENELFCARDHFGIKPLYYAIVQDHFYFASEIKALLPFLNEIKPNYEGQKDYLTFQLVLGNKTHFEGVQQLMPAHHLTVSKGEVKENKYWEVYYEPDFNHSSKYFEDKLSELFHESINIHLRSDVPVGAYVSGGVDSTSIASIASDLKGCDNFMGFTGKFSSYGHAFDESRYAQAAADEKGFELKSIDIKAKDFIDNIEKVIYHLDFPVAGPGSFPQYMVSELASKHRKVVLGGQGGDEIFGGYTRYLIAYFEQCIKGAINGNMSNGNYVVTYESIIPNLTALKNYEPMLKSFWSKGLFEPMDDRYYQLVNRAPNLGEEIRWSLLEPYSAKRSFKDVFNGDNVKKESYFDLMTHYDFKTLLPALLQVEDRMSMAHGLESRVPLLDYKIVELAATMPADIKFKNGDLKHLLKNITRPHLPKMILDRKDKMGFPTPINDWINGEANSFVMDILGSTRASNRDLVDNKMVRDSLSSESRYSRKVWGFLSMEIWNREFIDKASYFKKLIN
uniref:asparagine synthase (glutamine-hydrolyzing) n=1 Tax=Algoriphagus sp. TaxID=1872435 RepID=UPI004047EE4A